MNGSRARMRLRKLDGPQLLEVGRDALEYYVARSEAKRKRKKEREKKRA